MRDRNSSARLWPRGATAAAMLVVLTSLLGLACEEMVNEPQAMEYDLVAIPLPHGELLEGLVAYATNEGGDYDIYVKRAHGFGWPIMVTGYSRYDDTDPVFSPDGRKIAFCSDRNGNKDIYLVNADGTGNYLNEVRLTNHPESDCSPTWSPDGTRIAFSSMRDGDPEIFTLDVATPGAPRQITFNEIVDVSPAWSPNGEYIAYRSGGDIYMMRPSPRFRGQRLTTHPYLDDMPAWLPNGEEVSFATRRNGGRWDIYAVTTDGTRVLRPVIVVDTLEATSHSWSADGKHVAYTNMVPYGGLGDIYVLRNTVASFNLTPTVGDFHQTTPDWWVGPER